MIKIFGQTDKSFASNGDIVVKPLKAKVTKKDNSDFYLDLEVGLEYIDYIVEGNIVVADTPQGSQAFRITNPIKTKTKISTKALHVFYDSKNYLIESYLGLNKECNQILNDVNAITNPETTFETYSNIVGSANYECVRKSLYEVVNDLVSLYGGHLVRENFMIEIVDSIGQDKGVTIEYKKNLNNITCEEKWDNVVTQLLPVGKDGIMLNSLDESQDIYVYSSIHYQIPYTKTVEFNQEHILEDDYKDQEGNLKEDEYKQALIDDLRQQANKYIKENSLPKINYTLKANIDNITDIGDVIEVKDSRLGINITTNVIAFQYDCILKKYTQIEFGNFKNTLSNLIPAIASSVNKTLALQTQNYADYIYNSITNATNGIWKTIDNIGYSMGDGTKILNVVSNYGTYPRLMKYNATKTYLFLDDRYRVIQNETVGDGTYFALSARESDSEITIGKSDINPTGGMANAIGILSPNNDGRIIVFYRCNGTRKITVNSTEYTIPYYSIRAKVSDTSGEFPSTIRNAKGVVLWSSKDDESSFYIQDGKLMVDYVLQGGTIGLYEPFAITESQYVFFSRMKHNDLQRTYEYKINRDYDDICQDIGKIGFTISGGTIARSGNPELVIRGQVQENMDGVINPKTRAGMVSFAKIKGSTKYVGCIETSVNQTAMQRRNLNVQLFECKDIALQYISPTTPRSILLPNVNESRGAPFITVLDDGRMAIMFMSSQDYVGTKVTEKENNRVECLYITKLPVTEGMVETIDDSMFTKIDFFDFGNSQWGKWGAVQYIDGVLYKSFTYGTNVSESESTRYGNVVIYSQ